MKLNKGAKQKIVLVTISYLIFMVLFNNTILRSINKKSEEYSVTLLKEKAKFTNNFMKILNFLEIKTLYLKKDQEYLYLKKKFIKKEEKKEIIEKITRNGKEFGMIFKTISFKEEKEKNYEKIIISIKLFTNYEKLLNYLNSLDEMEKKVIVDDISIKKIDNLINVDLKISAYILNEVN